MRQIRWKIPFRTLLERDAVINIYDEGWVGGVTMLTPSTNPLYIEEDRDKDLLLPVRNKTGYVRVIDEDNLEGLVPMSDTSHYLEVLLDDVRVFQGYMKSAQYTSSWDATPLEKEFPVISCVEALASIEMDSSKDMGLHSFASLIVEALDASGGTFYSIIFPREIQSGVDTLDWYQAFNISVSRYNFFNENNGQLAGQTYKSLLESICKVLGWTLREHNSSIYFTHSNGHSYTSVSMSAFRRLAEDGTFPTMSAIASPIVDLENLEYDGNDHKSDILMGCRRFIVEADVNEVKEALPSLSTDTMRYDTTVHMAIQTQWAWDPTLNDMLHALMYKPDGNIVVFHSWLNYRLALADVNHWVEGIWSSDDCLTHDFASGGWGLVDTYKQEDVNLGKKYNYTFQSGIFIEGKYPRFYYSSEVTVEGAPTLAEIPSLPIVEIMSQGACVFASGALCISGAIGPLGTLTSRLWCSLSVGDLYWNGSIWRKEQAIFNLDIDTTNKKIANTKRLDQPYNGADGYLIPIRRNLSGRIKFIIFAPEVGCWFFLNGFKIGYYAQDTDDFRKTQDVNQYSSSPSGLNYRAEAKMELQMSSYDNVRNNVGYGTMIYQDRPLTTQLIINGVNARPEENLLKNMERVYGRSCQMLTLQLANVNVSPLTLIRDGQKSYKIVSKTIDFADEALELRIEDATFNNVGKNEDASGGQGDVGGTINNILRYSPADNAVYVSNGGWDLAYQLRYTLTVDDAGTEFKTMTGVIAMDGEEKTIAIDEGSEVVEMMAEVYEAEQYLSYEFTYDYIFMEIPVEELIIYVNCYETEFVISQTSSLDVEITYIAYLDGGEDRQEIPGLFTLQGRNEKRVSLPFGYRLDNITVSVLYPETYDYPFNIIYNWL